MCFLGGSWRIPNLDWLRSSPTESQLVSRVELWIHGCIEEWKLPCRHGSNIAGSSYDQRRHNRRCFFLSILDSRIQNIINVKQPHHVMYLFIQVEEDLNSPGRDATEKATLGYGV